MLKEDSIVLCTVKKVEGTTVFLEIEGDGEGSMTFSEVAPGRIRNIREFVSPNKKIVCKVLRIKDNHAELSLRRVTGKEREAVMEQYKRRKVFETVLKQALQDKTQKTLEEIEKKYPLEEFIEKLKENPSLIEEFVPKKDAEQLKKAFSEKKDKEKEVKQIIVVKSDSERGIEDIKSLLNTDKASVRYLGSSKFSIIVKEREFKIANTKMESLLKDLKDKSKALKIHLEVK